MQLIKKNGQIKSSFITMLALTVVACGNSTDSSGATNTHANNASGQTYEVVTVTQPENLKQYIDWYKLGYQACVGFANLKNIAVKPFVNVPADFIVDKEVYVRDGKNFLYSDFKYGIDMEPDPDKGCPTWIGKTESHMIIKNGKSYHVEVLKNGERIGPDSLGDAIQEPEKDTSIFPVTKIVDGFHLKCQENNATTNVLGEVCILEPIGATKFVMIDGKYVTGYARAILTKDQFGVLITKPVSVKANMPINSTVFDVK